jgi:hypothetical protein
MTECARSEARGVRLSHQCAVFRRAGSLPIERRHGPSVRNAGSHESRASRVNRRRAASEHFAT